MRALESLKNSCRSVIFDAMISQQIRKQFLSFFEQQGHALVPSSPVIPHDDPTLLFINAGMNQFKDVFLGKTVRDYRRATSSQKCIRVGGKHNDLENVGHTARHLTFFEMLGNFSFGDYFKKEAIAFAWKVSLDVFGFDPQFLWATVFHEDEEAFELWRAYLPEERIVRMGEKDNFWAMGDVGPCGPCTELYFDKGSRYGKGRSPAEDVEGERFLEFWNLVFMQYNKDALGGLHPLPKQSVDTGAGLERVVSLIMGVDSLFETDVLRSLITRLEEISHLPYRGEPAFRVIADHIRMLAFAIADGVQPSNLDRGYVLRKVLRRAVRYGRQLELKRPFLALLLPTLVQQMGEDFPSLIAAESLIADVLTQEEEAFLRTLKKGGNLLSQVIRNSTASHTIAGEDAFKLKDTYGLPLDEIVLLAKDAHLSVDINRFEELEHEAKERSRGARQATAQVATTSLYEEYGASQFLGYEQLCADAVILGLMKAGLRVDVLHAGEEGTVLLDRTPFYAERGGQVGDQGRLEQEEACFDISDCQAPYADVIAHHGLMRKGELRVGQHVTLTVDAARRQKIANNHTATHLLHAALVQVLGPHIKQAGSVVEASRLRFDFHHSKALSRAEVRELERLVNAAIRSQHTIVTYELPYVEAQKRSDIRQFFGEKYGTTVRVVDTGTSKELCGGTHVTALGHIGYFRIVKEGSISSGVRRIEAVTAEEAEHYAYAHEQLLEDLSTLLKTQPAQLHARVEKLLEEQSQLQQQLEHKQRIALQAYSKELLTHISSKGGIPHLVTSLSIPTQELKPLAECIMQQASSLLLVLLSTTENKCTVLVAASPDLVKRQFLAGELVSLIATQLGGRGGGKPDYAQGGGPHIEQIPAALQQIESWILSKNS